LTVFAGVATLGAVLTAVVLARCFEAFDASTSARLDSEDAAQSAAGVRS